jgi:hypothetical protein
MTQPKKRTKSAKASSEARGTPAAAPASSPSSRPAAPEVQPCVAALEAVIGLARASAREPELPVAGKAAPGTNADSSASGGGLSSKDAEERLTQTLRSYEPEMALKLRTLLVAGRDGRDIAAGNANQTAADGDAALSAMAQDLSENAPLLAEHLRRGYALACAAGVNLERPVAGWAPTSAQNIDERAWLSFGRQLAKSQPEDWQCLALLDAAAQQINKLYLKLGDNAWWSFQTQIDRPSAATVDKQGRALKRRSKGMATQSLRAVAQQLRSTEGRALRRAARAIRARVGEVAGNG